MSRHSMRKWGKRSAWLAVLALLLVPAWLTAAERSAKRRVGQFNPKDETIELFSAMESGQISVKLIPKDSTQARVFIENKTGKPVNVQLPAAFAAMPILAQMGGGQGGFGGGGQQGGGQQAGGGGMGGGGMGGGGGFFNVPAEKVGQFKVAMVCLEHGKDEPRPAVPYALKPLSAFSTDPKLDELMRMFGEGRCDQRSAQAAAWHISNKMSWEELANKNIERLTGERYPYFSQEEIATARQLVAVATQRAANRPAEEPQTTSPGTAKKVTSAR